MAGIYRPRHPERTVLYRVLFHYFDRFLADYEDRFQKEYGFLRPIIKEVVERSLDCGNPNCGFARFRCPACKREFLLCFSCRTRGFCPSCHAKRLEEWEEWMREKLLLDVPQRQVGYRYGKEAREVEWTDYLEFIAWVVSHIPDKGQLTVRCYGLYANAHRGKVRKSKKSCHKLLIIEEGCPRIPRRGWAEMIRKVYLIFFYLVFSVDATDISR